MTQAPIESMGTDALSAAAWAALEASSAEAARLLFALHERSPLEAAKVLLAIASGDTKASDEAIDRASDLAADLVDRDTFHEILAMIIRPVDEHGVRVTAPCDLRTLHAVFGGAWTTDADCIAASFNDEDTAIYCLLRFAHRTPRPDRTLAGGRITGPAKHAILERVFASCEHMVHARLGVAVEPQTPGLHETTIHFWVWGKRAVGFVSAFAEPLEPLHPEAEHFFYFSKEKENCFEVPTPERRRRAYAREREFVFDHPPGRYRVRAFLADRPLSEQEMRGAFTDAELVATARPVEVDIPESPELPPMTEEESEAIRLDVFARLDRGDVPELGVVYQRRTGTKPHPPGTLKFWARGSQAFGFLSAYAEPLGHEGKRIFYLSKEDDAFELRAPEAGTGSLRRWGYVTVSLRPGRYRVHAFLAGRPLTREEMVGGGGKARVVVKVAEEIEIVE